MFELPLMVPRNFNMFDFKSKVSSRILFQIKHPAANQSLRDQHYRLLRVEETAAGLSIDFAHMDTHRSRIADFLRFVQVHGIGKIRFDAFFTNFACRGHREDFVTNLVNQGERHHRIACHAFDAFREPFGLYISEPPGSEQSVLDRHFYQKNELSEYILSRIQHFTIFAYKHKYDYDDMTLVDRCQDIWRFTFDIPSHIEYSAPAVHGIIL